MNRLTWRQLLLATTTMTAIDHLHGGSDGKARQGQASSARTASKNWSNHDRHRYRNASAGRGATCGHDVHRGITIQPAGTGQIARTSPPVLNVPCNGCNACCYNHRIEVDRSQEPPERLARLDMVPDQYGDMKLRKRADGSCVHLGENGCTVYGLRPTTCRTYDCRMSCMLGIRRAYVHGDDVIEEPVWVFDQDSQRPYSPRSLPDGWRPSTSDRLSREP